MTGARLFGRTCEVLVGKGGQALVLATPLRFQVKVVKSLTKDPNSLELSISNLSPRSRAHLQGKGVDIVVQAGFQGAAGIIYSGQIRSVDHVADKGAGWTSKVKCGDTSKTAGQGGQPCVSESFGAGTGVGDVAGKLAGAMGVDLGNLTSKLGETADGAQFATGYTAFGHPARELEKVLSRLGLSYSIQDGQLLVLGPNDVATHFEVVQLSSDTGLIGSPELGTPEDKNGPPLMKAKCLMQPKLKPGCKLSLDSRSVKGLFRVVKVTHEGDTHGDPWFTLVEASRL